MRGGVRAGRHLWRRLLGLARGRGHRRARGGRRWRVLASEHEDAHARDALLGVLDVLAAAEPHRRLARGPLHRRVERLHGVHVGRAPHAIGLRRRGRGVEHEPRQEAAAQHVGRGARHEAPQRARRVERGQHRRVIDVDPARGGGEDGVEVPPPRGRGARHAVLVQDADGLHPLLLDVVQAGHRDQLRVGAREGQAGGA